MVKSYIPVVLSLAASAAAAYASHVRYRSQPTERSSSSSLLKMLTAHQRNIHEINRLDGYDVIIVCTSTPHQAQYWQDRLMATRGSISPKDAKVIAVFEDWTGGAGNGLGTLYAYTKAVAVGKELYGIDIPALLAAGRISVALYHTAGKGTRLAPLPGSENNNKSGVKLPAMVKVKNQHVPMTILEAVVKQTGVYACSRRGRLSVFWGDQVFIPSAEVKYEAKHHIDILAALAPMPSAEEWKDKGLEKYGLIAVNQQDNAAQVDKVTHETAIRLLSSFGEMKSVGTSLGSFSVDAAMLGALLSEFSKELTAKSGKLDSDPHFWMPLTLELEAYTEVMAQKGVDKTESSAHYQRMQTMLANFENTRTKELGLFGCVDVGSDVYWWDYGQLTLYLKNNRLVTKPGVEADCLRSFLGINNRMEHSSVGEDAVISEATVLNSEIEFGDIKRSVLSGVYAKEVNVTGSILINVTARSITAPNCVVYNVTSDEVDGLCLEDGSVVVGVLLPDGMKVVMRSNMNVCGGQAWKTVLEENQHSFEKIYELNADANVSKLEKLIQDEHLKMRAVVMS
uniref:RxLR effector candidate protein n=1 Tax=Hyaloperonospora arabidopsidis (strain Emoy2) TaxID=559515 RepID=M4BTH2_HYAAE